ncbi:MAG: MerR family transcriptional regulator [Actinobacteria bacterium]|nr:MerR family transcriptional regulator [Actinomycetota bacterium]
MTRTLTLAEFAELAASAVEAAGLEAPSSRVRVVPGERMLRYYVTQGLMDRPEVVSTESGREARYGRRHLLQFLATKRLQAGGASLAEIRDELAGADAGRLATLAAVPSGVLPDGVADASADVAPDGRAEFWRRTPDESVKPAAVMAAPQRTVSVIPVAPGAELHLDTARWTAAEIQRVAAAVRRALQARPAEAPNSPDPDDPTPREEPR